MIRRCFFAFVVSAVCGGTFRETHAQTTAKTAVDLEPETWKAKRFPLLSHTDLGRKLAEGNWKVLLIHHDCPECLDAIFDLRESALNSPEVGHALIEVPPHGLPRKTRRRLRSTVALGRLRSDRTWIVTTPVFLELREGIVLKVKTVRLPAPARTDARGKEAERLICDLGYIEPGSTHTVDFVIRNSGESRLHVKAIRPDCSCTRVMKSPEAIDSGTSGRVEVRFEAFKKPTDYMKGLTLSTDDPSRPTIRLLLKARIGLPLRLQTGVLDFGAVDEGVSVEKSIVVYNDAPKAIRLVYATSTLGNCYARIPREAVPAGGQVSLPIVLTISEDDRGATGRGVLRIQSTWQLQRALRVIVTYDARSKGEEEKGNESGR